ncbi:hypothetical protein [Brevundimonas guildfordensis]|uniref:DUF1488 domain-containing protein n=1 Tax=Brevundimonas guildfordensis TaxID=2762241 RepID=A0ABR8QWW8_9CAUL|nr:hypothetical protein [Brevundimonas guildfordensis]MBD7940024.1 hypothetical protein [Brevundimonas guildfordensis]
MAEMKDIEFSCGADRYWARTEYDASTTRWVIRIFDDSSAVVTGFEAFVDLDEVHDITGNDYHPGRVEAAARDLIREFIETGGEPRRYPED